MRSSSVFRSGSYSSISYFPTVGCLVVVCFVVGHCVTFAASEVLAQRVRAHDRGSAATVFVHVPRGGGGATPLSAAIRSQAQYLVAKGEFFKKVSQSRINHAQAADKEIDNYAKWIDTYFEGRKDNKAYRKQETPGYFVRQKKQQEIRKKRITDLYQVVNDGNVTKVNNWLLHELAGMTFPYRYPSDEQDKPELTIDAQLSRADLEKIRLTDGGRAGARKLTFDADQAKVLDNYWPLALRDPQFEKQRQHF